MREVNWRLLQGNSQKTWNAHGYSDCCPKSEGMQMLVRSMSPDVVAVDELGCEEDFKAVESVIHCGCKLIATAHGNCLEDILDQPFF